MFNSKVTLLSFIENGMTEKKISNFNQPSKKFNQPSKKSLFAKSINFG